MKHIRHRADDMVAVEHAIDSFFERSIVHAADIDSSYERLWRTLHELIRSGGKRLRPRMTLLAYDAFGGKDSMSILPVAVAQELLHFSLLIHDDIIDRDYLRYGTSNIAGSYKAVYREHTASDDDMTHYAHSAAMLGGDLMLSAAHRMVASSQLSDSDKIIAQDFLAHSIFEVAGGELLDTELSFMPYREGDALKVARYKTVGYSFVNPLLAGATLAGINENQARALRDYAIALGVAFQLVDDLLGVFGDESSTGKSTSSDIREGKMTYIVERAIKEMDTDQRKVFDTWFGNHTASDDGVAAVQSLLEVTGAKQATVDLVAEYVSAAHEAIDRMELDAVAAHEFVKLVKKVTERTK
ncbi:polyprenyl synthetase family protein [Candidatus Saccharibacteria bacterium]|nr:polyprenyl synthetase family protein [Candidatus Saccharibacteria bacterium]